MTTQAKSGFNTLLKRGNADGPPETFTTINEILSLKGPGLARAMIKADNMSSPNGREEVIPNGILQTGTIDLQVSYVRGDVGHTGLLSDIKTAALRNFQIVFPDDPTNPVNFAGYVQSASPDYPIAEKRTLTVQIKITGDITGI